MSKILSPHDAASLLRPHDTLGIPLGPGQPPAFLHALGERDDWQDLAIHGAHVGVDSDVFRHPGVHLLSTFWGPLERKLRAEGANVGFAPADFRRFAPLMTAARPRVMTTVATPPDKQGWCSLSLHAGATVDELRRAASDPNRLLVVEVSEGYPRTYGYGRDNPHAIHVDDIDVLVPSESVPFELAEPTPDPVSDAIAANAAAYVQDRATLQTGVGKIPTAVARYLVDGEHGEFGIHTEVFTDGLMRLHQAGKVANRKGQYDGVSIVTFAMGTAELYAWLHENREVAFLPVGIVNAPDVIARNFRMTSINSALSVDIHGQVVADTIDGAQFSGPGGQEDFISGPGLSLHQRSLVCLPATCRAGGKRRSRIVPAHGVGSVITTPRHQVDVVVTEHGAAELAGHTVHQRGNALAAIADPAIRPVLEDAAERASRGGSALPELPDETDLSGILPTVRAA